MEEFVTLNGHYTLHAANVASSNSNWNIIENLANGPFLCHTHAMNMVIEPDKHNRIVLTRDIRKAAGITPGEPMQLTVSPGRIVLEVKPESSGKIIKKGGLKVWTGKVPPIPLEEAAEKSRHYFR
jgi:hypothetical protein